MSDTKKQKNYIEECLKQFKTYLSDWGDIYFTFAGFVDISDDDHEYENVDVDGGDLLLEDKRGNSGVYVLDHELWEIHLIDKGKVPVKRSISSKELSNSFVWIMNMFSSWEHLKSRPLSHWENTSDIDGCYEEDKEEFDSDPHLALYWLLHFGLLLDERVEEVKELVKDTSNSLLVGAMAFLEELGAEGNFVIKKYNEPDDTTLFKQRRAEAIFTTYINQENKLQQWWYAYYLVEGKNFLSTSVRMMENVLREKRWGQLEEYLKKYDIQDRPGYNYIQVQNPACPEEKRSKYIDGFLKECLPYSAEWDGYKTPKKVLFEIYQQASDLTLLEKCIDNVWKNEPLEQDYLEIKDFIAEKQGKKLPSDRNALFEKAKKVLEALKAEDVDFREILGTLSEQEQKFYHQYTYQERAFLSEEGFFEKIFGSSFIFFLESKHPEAKNILGQLINNSNFYLDDINRKESAKWFPPVSDENDNRLENIFYLLQIEEAPDTRIKYNKEALLKKMSKIGHLEQVFSFYMECLETRDRHLIKELILSKVFQDNKTIKKLSGKQCEQLFEHCYDLLEDKEVGADARWVFYYFNNPKIKDWVFEKLFDPALNWDSKTRKDARNSLFSGLSNMGLKVTQEAILKRLQSKKEDYIDLGGSLWDFHETYTANQINSFHQTIVKEVVAKKDFNMAGNYLDALLHFCPKSEELIINLCENVQTIKEDIDLSRLKYIVDEAIVAKIILKKHDGLKKLAELSESIKEPPFSNRNAQKNFEQKTRLMQDEKHQNALKKILSKPLKTKTPPSLTTNDFKKINLKKLGKLLDREIKGSIWHHPEKQAILYYYLHDKLLAVDFHKGQADPGFQLVFIEEENKIAKNTEFKKFVKDLMVPEKVLMKEDKNILANYKQFDNKVLIYILGEEQRYIYQKTGKFIYAGLQFKNKEGAASFMNDLSLYSLPGSNVIDHWYKNYSGVRQFNYYRHGSPIQTISILNVSESNPGLVFYPEPEKEAENAFFKTELGLLQQNYNLAKIAYQNIFKEQETDWKTFLDRLFDQYNNEDPVGATIHSLATFEKYVATGLLQWAIPELKDLSFDFGPPAKKDQIELFTKAVPTVPEELVALWNKHSKIEITANGGKIFFRLLSPEEVLKNAEYQIWLEKNSALLGKRRELNCLKNAYEICQLPDSKLVLCTKGYGKCPERFFYYEDNNIHFAFEERDKNFAQSFCRTVSHCLIGNIIYDNEILGTLNLASTPEDFTKIYLENKEDASSKFYEILLDKKNFQLIGRYGKINTKGKISSKVYSSIETLAAAANKLQAEKEKKGYVVTKK